MVESEKVLLLFSNAGQMIKWQEALCVIGVDNFCLAFDHTQALNLLKNFQGDETVKAVLGDPDLLDVTHSGPDVDEFFTLLDAQVAQTLILPVTDKVKISETRVQVLGHLQSQRPKKK